MSALLGAFALFLASYAPLAEGVLDAAVPHGSRILSDCASLGATAAVLAVSLQLNLGPARAKRLIRPCSAAIGNASPRTPASSESSAGSGRGGQPVRGWIRSRSGGPLGSVPAARRTGCR